jgi:GTPase SAR1 family protein
MMVFDITNRASFESVRRNVLEVEGKANNHGAVMVLVGNKKDLVMKRVVMEEDARKLSREYGIKYIEISVK